MATSLVHDFIWPSNNIFSPDYTFGNRTGLCNGEIHVEKDWYIVNLGGVITALCVLTVFTYLFRAHKDAGSKIWRSPWIFVFYGYLAMQAAAIPLFLYFHHFEHGEGWRGTVNMILMSTDIYGGYWIVGQFLITGPLVDMGCLKWSEGCCSIIKIINLVLAIVMACVLYGIALHGDPWESPVYQKIVHFTSVLVYLGNFLVIIETFVKRWVFTKAGLWIFISTILNVIALVLRFKTTNISKHEVECLWYVLEGLSLILIWFFFVDTRDKLEDDDEIVAGGHIQWVV